jgi:hypothetical protein
MSSTTTPVIGLFKPVPGTAEPFRVADLNDNMDLLDAAYGSIGESVDDVNDALIAVEAALEDIEEGLASLDTAAILEAIDEGFSIDGGTA